MLAETRRKSLPRLGKTVHADPQALHHFLANADWSVEALRRIRLELLRQALGETPFILCLDETGDRKKGHPTEYAATQDSGQQHTLTNRVVSVNAYGVRDTTTFPLLFRVFNPASRLKPGDVYQTKPPLAIAISAALLALGFHFSVVLADSLYGESGPFLAAVPPLGPPHLVPLRSPPLAATLPGQPLRPTRRR